jgi:enoyl-CoA hydratase
MSDLATYELNGRIATIAMDDGKVNALSIAMLRTLHAALDQAGRDRAIVLLTGREGYFSAGFDLRVFALRARGAMLEAMRAAIETEITNQTVTPGT